MEVCKRHEQKYNKSIKHIFPAGSYTQSKSIFDRIDKQLYNIGEEQEVKEEKECKGKKQLTAEQQEIKDDLKKTYLQKNYTIDENDKYYPFECAFDFEAMVKKISKVDVDKQSKKFQLNQLVILFFFVKNIFSNWHVICNQLLAGINVFFLLCTMQAILKEK